MIVIKRCANRTSCVWNHCDWKFSYSNWPLACTLYLDLLLCSKVYSSHAPICMIVLTNIDFLCMIFSLSFIFCPCLFATFDVHGNFRSKKLGLVLKILVLAALPVPLILWPVIGILGSILGGVGYGFFSPLLATFEAAGENFSDKFYHCFAVCFFSTLFFVC